MTTRKGLGQANILRTNNNTSTGYGIAYADEVSGHRTVGNLTALYALNDWQLSASGDNTNSDAIGQLWYVVDADGKGNGALYQLKDWSKRKEAAGWSEFNSTGASTAEQEIIYDVSARNDGAIFESLQALLSSSDLSTLIPTSVRHGGMTIRFIQGSEQSSDNKYVQFRLMNGTFSTIKSDWQGIDSTPIVGSQNLVTSGGVAEKTKGIVNEDLPFGTADDEIQIQDDVGNVIHRFNENYADFKNLKSNGKDVATVEDLKGKQDKIDEISQTSTSASDDEIQIQDDEGNVIHRFNENYADFKNLKSNGKDVATVEDYKYKGYIDVNYNSSVIAPFLLKYARRIVDDFGQLTIHLCGDSIFGRQDKGSTWNPSNPEMSLTPDMNDPNETQPGYITGHFPPNAWEQLVGYRLIKALQYSNSEVKYYNHVASEVTKTGSWSDLFPVAADCLRLCSSVNNDDSISLTFSNAKYAKFIVSNYVTTTSAATIKVDISEDNGLTFNTPSELGLTESHINSGVSGEHSLSDLATIKFAELCWSGFDSSKSYIIRITHTNTSILRVWGFETWNNPRINIVNCAEGGNTATSQNAKPRRFYNSNSKPSLVIYELPYLNDLGVGVISNYGGFITPTSTPTATPSNEYTYCCNEDGIYANFGNIKAYKYDYISYNSVEKKWVHGSPKVDSVMANYLEQCETSLKRIKRIGIPILTIITHNSNAYTDSRHFMMYDGLNILRGLTKKYGYATIDLNAYQMSLPNPKILTNSPADGTHLNDTGSELYADMITQIVTQKIQNSIGSSSWDNNSFYGEGAPGNVVFEGNMELSTVPKIYILDNNSIIVTNVTNTGFTATGSGVFTYKAILNV